MVDFPLDPPRLVAAALRPYLAPALRHAGWFGFFLILAPVIGPRGYGLFVLALSGIAIVEAVLVESASFALRRTAVLDERHWATALATMMVAGTAVSLLLYAAAGTAGAIAGEDGFGDMFRSLATLPLLGALSVVPSEALRREGRNAALTASGVAGLAAGGGIAMSLAWAGAGAWSLVAQIVVQRLVECTVLWGIPGERVGLGWSRRHFADLWGGIDRRVLPAIWSSVATFGSCIAVGAVLGLTATGLYMLAARLGQALIEGFLTPGDEPLLRAVAVQRACRVLLPAVLASLLLVVALPPMVDLRWWGAVLPGQILLLGAIPAAILFLRAADADSEPGWWRWQTVEALGALAATAFAARYGLVAIAAANTGWLAVLAAASVRPIRRKWGAGWRAAWAPALRPCGGAMAAGAVLFRLSDPVSLTLPTLTALCLLTAGGWLVYLIVRGDPVGAAEPLAPAALTAPIADG